MPENSMVLVSSLFVRICLSLFCLGLCTPGQGCLFLILWENHPRTNFLFLAGYYFLGMIGKNFMTGSREEVNF